MTATEQLLAMLDERGVEYVLDEEYGEKYPPEKSVTWSCDLAGEDMTVTARDYFIGDGEYCLDLEFHEVFTPEQAIAATLGPFKDQFEADMWDMFMSGGPWIVHSEYMKLHSEYMKLKAEYDELKATLSSCNCSNNCTNSERTETCHPVISDNLTESEGTGDAWADCSECGHLLFVLTDPNSQVPNYCPNCGRRVEQ